jgi:hypothetical protein
MTDSFLDSSKGTKTARRLPRCHVNLASLAFCLAMATTAGQSVRAQVATSSCAAPVQAMLSEWYATGFPEPVKPGQSNLHGSHGRTATAGQFYYMRAQLNRAVRACRDGRDEEALQRIRVVRNSLDHTERRPKLYAKE